jgi:hypothetical protein
MPRRPAGLLAGGQGVRSDPESEGFEEKYRAVIEWGRPLMNRSAKDGIRSSPHYGGEGVTHSPIVPRCLLAARYGRFMCDPRRPVGVLVFFNQVSDPISESEMGSDARAGVGERHGVRWAAHESWGLKSPRCSDEGRCIQKRG